VYTAILKETEKFEIINDIIFYLFLIL